MEASAISILAALSIPVAGASIQGQSATSDTTQHPAQNNIKLSQGQLTGRRDNVISTISVKSINVDFLNQIPYFLIK